MSRQKLNLNWKDPVAVRRYHAEHIRERRRLGLTAMNSHKVRKIQVGEKRDIFEVAAAMAKAIDNMTFFFDTPQAQQEMEHVQDAKEALAAYRKYWEQD